MKRFTQIMVIVAIVIVSGFTPLLAQEMGHGKMGQGQGMESMAMDKKMQELQQHEKMMESIEDQKQLMTEMKKHMQMMTDMMGHSCCKLGGMSGQPGATSGSGGMSEHQ